MPNMLSRMANLGFANLGAVGGKSSELSRGWKAARQGVAGSSKGLREAYGASVSRGRKRAAWGGAGLVGMSTLGGNRAPSGSSGNIGTIGSSGTTGLSPHSSGGATML